MIPYWRLSLHYFFYFAFIGTFSPYFGLYLKSLDFSAWDIGVLMSLMQVMRLVSPNLGGWLSDRLKARVGIVRGASVLACLGFAGLFATSHYTGIFIAIAVMSFFWTASLPLIEALTLGHLDRQAERYGGIRLWGSIGFVVAVLGVGMTLDHVAEHVVLWASASFLLGMAVTSFFMTESPIPASGAAFGRLRDVVISPPVRSFLAASFFMSAAHGALYVFYSLYLVSEGYSKTQVGALWTLGVIAEILVFAFMPQLFRRFSIKAVLLFCFACAGLRFALIGFGVGSPVLLVLAQLMHGATFGAHHASAMAVIHRWFGPGQHARGQALYGSLSFGAGGMMGALLSGAVWETLGPALCFSLASAFGWAGWLIISRTHFEEPQHGR